MGNFLRRNGSTILTCLGGVGVIATSVMAAVATPKALELVRLAEEEKQDRLTKTEVVIATAPAYIPTIVMGAATIACIFGANMLNTRQQAAITSAYALLDSSYKEYKKKVDELYGEDAGRRVRGEIAKDSYNESEVVVEDKEKQLFYDLFSDRYFESTIEDVQRAEYRVNRHLATRDYVYLNEFYEEIGIEPIESGYQLGWSTGLCYAAYWQNWIDFTHEKVVLDDNLECYIIKIQQDPIVGFEDY